MQKILAGRNESLANEAFRRIRAGEEPSAIVEHFQTSPRRNRATALSPDRRRAFRDLLVVLALSTVSLSEIVHIAGEVSDPRVSVVMPRTRNVLQVNREFVITRTYITDILANVGLAQASLLPASPTRSSLEQSDGSHDGPLFWVPAAPWVTIIHNEFAVSHLISIFFATINPYWRFLEEDLFLRGMRSRDLDSEYCSPALVSAVLACAAVSSPSFPLKLRANGTPL